MKADSLWYEVRPVGRTNRVDVTLQRCLNCGQIKILTSPCSLDHLAAVIEFRLDAEARADHTSPPDCTCSAGNDLPFPAQHATPCPRFSCGRTDVPNPPDSTSGGSGS